MLKWAVNNPNRPSIIDSTSHGEQLNADFIIHKRNDAYCKKKRLRRKTSGNEMTNIRRKILNRDKENNLTSTPLPLHRQSLSPLRRYDSLRDLSNIPPTSDLISTPLQTAKLQIVNNTNRKNHPPQYASTLPTFDAEYSPCSLVPGPVLALRGIGIADSYFENPRYLANGCSTINPKRLKPNSVDTVNQLDQQKHGLLQDSKIFGGSCTHQTNEDESLSSSRMGDTTLDRMIDAILESARKERRVPKLKHAQVSMSPTYTRAEDPASDLNEFWHDFDEKDQYNEREVRTPDSIENTIRDSNDVCLDQFSCHLRRQPAVRRKRKRRVSKDNPSDKPIVSVTPTESYFLNNSFLRKSYDELVEMDTPKGYSNLSPDSGRNSASDLEESRDDNNETMRRKHSFSRKVP